MRDIKWVDFRFSLGDWKSGPVLVEGIVIPRRFTIDLMLMDLKPGSSLLWSTKLKIEFNSEEVPRALSVMTKGFSHSKTKNSIKKLKNAGPVELWQLEFVEKNLSELIALAVSCAAKAITWESEPDIMKEVVYSQQVEGKLKKQKTGGEVFSWDDPELFSKWATNNKFNQNNYDSGVEWKIDDKTLQSIQENIIKRTRRRLWTDSFISEIAEIYKDETNRAKIEKRRAKPVEVIKTHFGASNRTVDFWIKEARIREKIDPVPARKKSKNEKK